MGKLSLFALVSIVFLSAGTALATCPTPPSDRQGVGPDYLYDYTQDQSCYSTTSGVSTGASVGCAYESAWSFGSGTNTASTSFTITSSDPILDPDKWTIESNFDFTSPGQTSNDRFEVDVDVIHPNNTVSYYTLFFWSGASGNYYTCSSGGRYMYFSANTGDTINVTVAATNSGNATIKITVPRLTNQNF